MNWETRSVYELEIEVRQEGREIVGSFPYNGMATTSNRGRVRKETIAPHAFEFAINDVTREINILAGHDIRRPLASRLGGSLTITDSATSVDFRAALPPLDEQPTWMVDQVKAIRGGLVLGISPGFMVPPRTAVPNAEDEIPEAGNPGVFIRRVNEAVLIEMSPVTRPAYGDTLLEVREELVIPDPYEVYRWL